MLVKDSGSGGSLVCSPTLEVWVGSILRKAARDLLQAGQLGIEF